MVGNSGARWRRPALVMRGRKPKPTALKILQGNPGHRPIGDVMSTDMPATPGIPTPPEHLDEIARKQWFRLCDELHSFQSARPAWGATPSSSMRLD